MPLPTQLHRDKALEQVSVAYMPNEFIADRLVPTVPVKHESDVYYVYDQDISSMPETLRADGSPSRQATYNLSTSSYRLEEHSINDIVTDRSRNNSDKALKLEVDATEILTRKILIRREYECASVVFNSSNFSNSQSLSSGAAWTSNTTTSSPIINIDSATSKIIASSGFTPNRVVMDDASYRACKNHVSIQDRVKYTSADSITENMLAKLFDVQEVLVGRAIRDTSDEGLSADMGFIWTNCAFVAYMETSPGLKKASAMYKFQGVGAGSPYVVNKWRDNPRKGDVIEVSSMFQFKPVATSCAYLFKDTA